jgi:polar amino acid transport system permease protein
MRSFGMIDFISLLSGLKWTVYISFIALTFGAPLALIVAIMRSSKSLVLNAISIIFIQFVQGIPLLGLLMFFYFVIPNIVGFNVSALVAILVTYMIYTGAFLGEIWRGSIQAIKPTQWEAAASLGLSRGHQFTHVIAPQAFRIALPQTVNFLVQLIKNTSLASIVGFVELARSGAISSGATFEPLLVYSIVAALYFSLCFPLAFWANRLEGKMHGIY